MDWEKERTLLVVLKNIFRFILSSELNIFPSYHHLINNCAMLVWSFHKKLLDTNSWRRMHSMENSNPTSLQLIKSSKHQKQGYGRQIRLFEELLKSRLCHPQPHRLYRTPTTCSLRVWLMLSCSVILWNRIKIQSGWKELFALCMRGNNNNCAIHKNLLACIYTCMPPLINPKQRWT